MKKCILMGIGALAASSLFVACTDGIGLGFENSDSSTGRIALDIDLNKETVTSRSAETQSRADSRGEEIGVSDLSLRLTKNDGSRTYNWASVSEFDTNQQFGVGEYTFEAFYGDVNEQDFDKPAYYGSQKIVVADGQTTRTALTATMSKSMVTIKYTDAFTSYMADWSASVNGVEYAKDETRPVYVTPGDVTIKINVTKPNGKGAEFTLDPVEAQPRYHYTVTVDVNNGNVGDVALTVTFDENFEGAENIEIDLSDKLLSTPAPETEAVGFVSGEPVEVIAGVTADRNLAMNFIALAGLKEVNMTTQSASLIAKGWPQTIDLIAADGAMQTTLTGLGLKVLGLWKNTGEMGVVDFSDVVRNIASSDASASFTVTVKDKLMRESDPMVLAFTLEDVKIDLSSDEQYYSPGSPLEVKVGFNGGREALEENLVVKYKNPVVGVWRPLEIVSVSEGKSRAMSDYVVTVIAPELDIELSLRADYGDVKSNEIPVEMAPYAIDVIDYNVYASHVYVSVSNAKGGDVPSSDTWQFMLQKSGAGAYEPVSHEMVDGLAHITGLTPGTYYRIKATVDGVGSRSTSFTTEEGVELPNGDFETLGTEYSGANVRLGGQWKGSLSSANYNTTTFTFQEANGWATTNQKTMNGKTMHGQDDNTWFNQPSVFSSNIEYDSKCPGGLLGAGSTSGTPEEYKGFKVHNGDYAMVIRNVGWDPEGTLPAQQTNSNYYNSTIPKIANHSVGKMFLGTYSYVGGVETYNEGIDFNSRPTALTGWYTYDNNGFDDNGVVTVEVLSGSDVIASGNAVLASAGEYTEFTVNLSYTVKNKKATSLRVMVASSKHASTDMKSETANVGVKNYITKLKAYQHGATLVVDDFKLVY